MRDIRRPYRNLNTNNNFNSREQEKLQELEDFEMRRNYNDLEFNKNGAPIMRANNHFDMDGINKRNKDEFDVLKRDDYFSLSNRNNKISKQNLNRVNKKRHFIFSKYFYLFLIFLLGLGFYLFTYIFNTATITVYPKYKDINISETLDFNISDLLIATSSESLSKSIPKSAPKEINSKASGEIIIYNKFSSSPQKLVKNTRFETKDGKIFRISDSVIVPGKKSDNTPGSIKAKVSADTYGADYNIAPSDFTIPGFKNTPRYNAFYARSISNMTGGSSGRVTIVDEKDIKAAKEELFSKNKMKLIEKLKNINYDEYIPLNKDNPIYLNTDNANSLLEPKNNTYTLNTNANILFIKNDLLADAITKSILNINDQKYRIDNVNNINFTLQNNLDLSNKNATVTVLLSGNIRLIVVYDKEDLLKSLIDKKVSDFTNIMSSFSKYFSSQEYKLSPSWQRHFPNEYNKLKLIEEFK